MFLLETHETTDNIKTLRNTFDDFDVYTRGRNPKRRKQYQGRGGVACVAKKNLTKVGLQPKSDDLLWITVGDLNLAVVYFVPSTSPFADKNDMRMQELQTDILTMKQKGEVIILTDANAWIGEQPSIIEISDNEREIYKRKSTKPEVNTQGMWFISCMNSVNMIILNGIKSEAKYTYDHPSREATSIVDFIVTDEKVLRTCSDMQYFDYRELLDTDHCMITLEIQTKLQPGSNDKHKQQKGMISSTTKRNM